MLLISACSTRQGYRISLGNWICISISLLLITLTAYPRVMFSLLTGVTNSSVILWLLHMLEFCFCFIASSHWAPVLLAEMKEEELVPLCVALTFGLLASTCSYRWLASFVTSAGKAGTWWPCFDTRATNNALGVSCHPRCIQASSPCVYWRYEVQSTLGDHL